MSATDNEQTNQQTNNAYEFAKRPFARYRKAVASFLPWYDKIAVPSAIRTAARHGCVDAVDVGVSLFLYFFIGIRTMIGTLVTSEGESLTYVVRRPNVRCR